MNSLITCIRSIQLFTSNLCHQYNFKITFNHFKTGQSFTNFPYCFVMKQPIFMHGVVYQITFTIITYLQMQYSCNDIFEMTCQ